jgi:hypothetical protein
MAKRKKGAVFDGKATSHNQNQKNSIPKVTTPALHFDSRNDILSSLSAFSLVSDNFLKAGQHGKFVAKEPPNEARNGSQMCHRSCKTARTISQEAFQ